MQHRFWNKLLDAYSFDVIYKHSSFSAFCQFFNALNANFYGHGPTVLEVLDEKRLSESWNYFRFLHYCFETNQKDIVYRNIVDLGEFAYLRLGIEPGLVVL
jgi:hypothetical protein